MHVPLVDAACVDPEVLQPILSGLFGTERYLSVADLLPVWVPSNVLEDDLSIPPSVREDSIRRDSDAAKVR